MESSGSLFPRGACDAVSKTRRPVNLEDFPNDPQKTLVLVSYTMLGVAHPWALGMLAYQANSIKHYAEAED